MARAGRVTHHALRLRLDSSALQNNWRWLQRTAGVPTAAAVKADGYGLGAIGVTRLLAEAGCRDFFVSTWAEVEALGPMPLEAELVVLHGVGPEDLPAALAGLARPMLNTPDQIARWKEAAPKRPWSLSTWKPGSLAIAAWMAFPIRPSGANRAMRTGCWSVRMAG